jgi:hypothetical protein
VLNNCVTFDGIVASASLADLLSVPDVDLARYSMSLYASCSFLCRRSFSKAFGLLMSLRTVIRLHVGAEKLPDSMLQAVLEDAAHAGVCNYLKELEDNKDKRISIMGAHFPASVKEDVVKHAQRHYLTKTCLPNPLLRKLMAKEDNQQLEIAVIYGELKVHVEPCRLTGTCPSSSKLLDCCDALM